MESWRERISVNPVVCHGKACIRGTRIMVPDVVDNVAAGLSRQDILRSYPALTDADIEVALAYAAELTREGTVKLPLELELEIQDRREPAGRLHSHSRARWFSARHGLR